MVAAALERGYNCLTYDGPGQGGVLRQREVPLRPDWESVVIPRSTLLWAGREWTLMVGTYSVRSFGGYLATRGAALEHRLAAVIADPGQFDEFDMAMARMPQEIREAIEQGAPKVDSFLEKMMQDDAQRFS